jgi:hypothetical protein
VRVQTFYRYSLPRCTTYPFHVFSRFSHHGNMCTSITILKCFVTGAEEYLISLRFTDSFLSPSLILPHSFQKARRVRHVFCGRNFGQYSKNGEKDHMWHILLRHPIIRVICSRVLLSRAPRHHLTCSHQSGFSGQSANGAGGYINSFSLV